MDKEKRDYYRKKYSHLNLWFSHGEGWDNLTYLAALELDSMWPDWMPNWVKRLNNRLLYAHKGKSLVRVTKFYHSKWRKLLPFIKDYPRFRQIKEKYGTLRLYGGGVMENIGYIMSYQTCENCGSNMSVGQTNGWVQTLCEKCASKKPGYPENWTKNE